MSLWAEEENQEPVVTNPIAKQLDYERVLVTYDVKDVAVSYTHLTLPTNREV